ncbi:MAG: hypothetical protein LBV33_04210 [Lachnospiraceae bacterium]|nr:hypothetical protein [Lachnospiraceae bacterium]
MEDKILKYEIIAETSSLNSSIGTNDVSNPSSEKSIRTCDECGSKYYESTSQMASLCPECAYVLYGYDNCDHTFLNGRCIKCFWDGTHSKYIKKIKKEWKKALKKERKEELKKERKSEKKN